jgi:hypothetical protein
MHAIQIDSDKVQLDLASIIRRMEKKINGFFTFKGPAIMEVTE